ncbi:MAG: 5-methyltetrahydrofolate--homocysteine methyltransferase, partial [Pseudomonadota bacterium]|nr:5-methyltetrahydrofolate--homocysteine methyltransferase [Pseudomonadota bacterium]
MKNRLVLSAIASALLLAGCGDAETNIVELDPIEVPEDDHDHDGHDHDDDHDSDYDIESEGRLVVADAASNTLTVFDLDYNSVLDTFSATFDGSSVSASADYRFAVINSR